MKKGFLIDMDGVIYSGEELIRGADHFIRTLQERQIPFLFMTNNSQRTPLDVVNKLSALGIEVRPEDVFTSAIATAQFLAWQKPGGTAFVLGEGGILTSLHENGYSLVSANPDFVVVGEGRNFTLEMVNTAVDLILDGSRLIATNLDPSPKIKGWNNLGIKAVVAMLEEATGIQAMTVGKPSPIMMRSARKRIGLATSETTVIGDTMTTDIIGGLQMGYRTVLTLSGVTKRDELSHFAYGPDHIIDSIADIDIEMLLSED